MSLSFQEQRLIEQLRYMEESGSLPLETLSLETLPLEKQLQETMSLETMARECRPQKNGRESTVQKKASASFEQRLLQRAGIAVQTHRLQSDLQHASRQSKRFSFALSLAAMITGAMAVLKAISAGGQTLNVYWLLLVLLGFNFLSLALWLASLAWRPTSGPGAANGLLKAIWNWVEPRLIHKNPRRAAADRGWLMVSHHGSSGYWWLAGLSHGMWLAYLGAGLVTLLLLLMIRQFDFIWATTILSEHAFITLTQSLAAPLRALGIPTPDLEQIRLSRQGLTDTPQGEARRLWAAFLLGALLIYGVLPRLLLLLAVKAMETLSRRRYRLNLNHPYYLRLRHLLMPDAGAPRVVDPDPGKAAGSSPRLHNSHLRGLNLQGYETASPPAGAYWIGVELTSEIRWPPAAASDGENLGQITGSETLRLVIGRLSADPDRERVAAVAAGRLPDRGLKRTLAQLYASSAPEQRWLAVLCPTGAGVDKTLEQRLRDWHAAAADCNIPSRHLTLIQERQKGQDDRQTRL